MKRNAFTLIELLIVVAIIAILAAIAVPNFLEAQVRSKVSRQLSNMRTTQTAMESYYVDNNKYPLTTWNNYATTKALPQNLFTNSELWKFWPGREGSPGGLTTPIAYISGNDALVDIFRLPHNFPKPLANQIMYLPTDYYTSLYIGSTTSAYPNQMKRYGYWTIRSAGPDTYYQNQNGVRADYGAGGWGQASYEPTNGTVSNGDIYRSQKKAQEDHI